MRFYLNSNNKDKFIEYCVCKSINHTINLLKSNTSINNIISYNYHVSLIDWNFNKDFINIKYNILFNILYEEKNKYLTYTLKDERIGISQFNINKTINGESLTNILSRKGIFIDCTILSCEILDYNEKFIKLYIDLQLSIKILKIAEIAYIIKISDYEQNIYCSLEDGKDFLQLTFEENCIFKNINFYFDSSLIYIQKKINKVYIKKLCLDSNDITDIYENKHIKNYIIFDSEHLLILLENNSLSELILLNILNNTESKYLSLKEHKIINLLYANEFLILYYDLDNITYLQIIDKDKNNIFKFRASISYIDISPCKTFLIFSENNELKILFFKSKSIFTFDINSFKGIFIKFQFIDKNQILIYSKDLNNYYLTIFNLSNNNSDIILSITSEISCFLIDYNKKFLYYSLKENNKYNIYSLTKNRLNKKILDLNANSIFMTTRS